MNQPVLAVDIGGANLKAAHSRGLIVEHPFELWKHPAQLPAALEALLRQFPPGDVLAVTMTGELCDCFASKRQGVNAILDAVASVAGSTPIRVWTTAGRFVDVPTAREHALLTAAANWHALATFAGPLIPGGPGLLIDIGSTTTDIIPLLDGKPDPTGRTDPERLRSGELVYTGVTRTPVCALLGSAGAAEFFATTLDVYLVLGWIAEDPSSCAGADGGPATRAAAQTRLARMLCADAETCTPKDIDGLAQRVCQRQLRIIRAAIHQVCRASRCGPSPGVILAGSGEFLARRAMGLPPALPTAHIISLADQWGEANSRAGCAYALAQLLNQEQGGSS